MEHPPQAVYDHSAMMDRLMGDQELVKAVIRRFLEDLPQQVNRLKQSLEAGDAQSVHRQIHSIKGAAANISANSLVSLALRMEKAAAEGNLQSVTESLPALENQFGQFQKAVAEFI
jgi:HPt (histidine-containing phosphotransfer) domain-containing protein